jgi:hypothetical protein
MIARVVVAMVVALLAACGGDSDREVNGPAEIVSAFFGALRSGDVDGLKQYVHWPAAVDAESPGAWHLLPDSLREAKVHELATAMVGRASVVLENVKVRVGEETINGDRAEVLVEEVPIDGLPTREMVECIRVGGVWKVVQARHVARQYP